MLYEICVHSPASDASLVAWLYLNSYTLQAHLFFNLLGHLFILNFSVELNWTYIKYIVLNIKLKCNA